MRVAVVDIGSNSVQMLVAEIDDGQWRQLAAAECVTRLAEGLRSGQALDPGATGRTFEAVEDLADRARKLGAERLWAVGTRSFRLARDGSAFAARLEHVIGEPVEILSEEREAELGFEGAVSGLGCARGRVLSVDIGGGSTEIVSGHDGRPFDHVSLPFGAVVLTEQYLGRDPSPPEDVAALRAAVFDAVRTTDLIRRYLDEDEPHGPLIGSGGTLVTLAAMAAGLDRYRADIVHGSSLARSVLRAQCVDLGARSIAERKSIRGLGAARAPTILAGAVVADVLVDATGAEAIVVSDHGLRHAVLQERVLALALETRGSLGIVGTAPPMER